MSDHPSRVNRAKSPSSELDPAHLRTIATLNDQVIREALRDEDTASALALLKQLESAIRGGHYGTFSSNRKHEHYHMFVCLHNAALAHQQRGDNLKAREHLTSAIDVYEMMQGYLTSREENVVFIRGLAELQLQLCGLLSHCDQHSQAAVLAEKSLDRVAETARILQAVCYEQMLLSESRETTCSSREKVGRNEMVDFKAQVIQEAEKALRTLSQLPPAQRVLAEERERFSKIISNIFSWKENADNNEALLRKELRIPPQRKSQRNILGLQKHSAPRDYEIGALMMLEFRTIGYPQGQEGVRLLSSHSLRQLAFCAAAAYFTVATESRFSEKDLCEIRGSMRIDQKYQRLNHDERLLKCKILHLKAMEVAGAFLPPGNVLFAHLCQSFSRNYKFVMDEIHEVSQLTSTTTIRPNEPRAQQKEETSIFVEYGIQQSVKVSKKVSRSRIERSMSRPKDKAKDKEKENKRLTTSRSQKKSRLRSSSRK